MSARGAVLERPARPQVNLLPPEIRSARTFSVVRRWLLISVALSVVVGAMAFFFARFEELDAAAELEQETAQTSRLLTEQQAYTDVTSVHGEVDSVRAARARAFATEIMWSEYLDAVVAVTPDAMTLTTVSYVGATPVTAHPDSVNPLVSTAIGTLSFTARSTTLPDTAAWTDALDRVPGLRDTWVSVATLTDEEGVVRYDVTATVQVDETALAHRYDATEPGTAEQGGDR